MVSNMLYKVAWGQFTLWPTKRSVWGKINEEKHSVTLTVLNNRLTLHRKIERRDAEIVWKWLTTRVFGLCLFFSLKENKSMCFTWLGDPWDILVVHDKMLQSLGFHQDSRMPDEHSGCVSLPNLTSKAAEFEYIHINKAKYLFMAGLVWYPTYSKSSIVLLDLSLTIYYSFYEHVGDIDGGRWILNCIS